jgi:hypothetical protein
LPDKTIKDWRSEQKSGFSIRLAGYPGHAENLWLPPAQPA